jgi:ABC-type multidrug transport system fused ATPase/permease subunit
MNKFKGIFSWLTQRSIIIISILIIGVGILLICFISTGSSSTGNIAIGIASISAFLAAISAIANLLSAVEAQKQRENNERPYIQGYFDSSNSGAIYFTIQNFGNSPTIDVTI